VIRPNVRARSYSQAAIPPTVASTIDAPVRRDARALKSWMGLKAASLTLSIERVDLCSVGFACAWQVDESSGPDT
jgi:hypothetical protein